MPVVVTINRPDVVARIERLANRLTRGNKTEVVAMALRNLEDHEARTGSLFGLHRGTVAVRGGVDLTEPALQDSMDAEHGELP